MRIPSTLRNCLISKNEVNNVVSKDHISLLSLLVMENHSNPERPVGWHVDLSIWRVELEFRGSDKYAVTPIPLLKRVEVYPTIADPRPTVTITLQDLVMFHRNKDNSLLDITMEIAPAKAHRVAARAVTAKQTKALKQPSSPVNPDQLAPSPPLGASEASEDSYRDQGGSEETASQRLTTPLSPISHSSQNDTGEERDHEEAGIDVESDGDNESDFTGNSALAFEQRTTDHIAKSEEEKDLGVSLGEDADGA